MCALPLLALLLVSPQTPAPTSVLFTGQAGTGIIQEWKVPLGVEKITLKLWGGGGGSSRYYAGGCGEYRICEATVTPGERLEILVGAGGYPGAWRDDRRTAFGGGAMGALPDGAGGGGASIVRRSRDFVAVAAGGGGAGSSAPGGHGGMSGGFLPFLGSNGGGRTDGPPAETPAPDFRNGAAGAPNRLVQWAGETASADNCGGGGGGTWGGGCGHGNGGAGGGGYSEFGPGVTRLAAAWDQGRYDFVKFGKSQSYYDFKKLDPDWRDGVGLGAAEGRSFGGPGQIVIIFIDPDAKVEPETPTPDPEQPKPSDNPGPSIAEQARREEELRRRRDEQALLDRAERAFREELERKQREMERLDRILISDEPNQRPAFATWRRSGSEMVYIPKGRFWRGDMASIQTPGGLASLDGYWIDVAPVSVARFRRYVETAKVKFDWEGRKPSWGWIEDHPMVNVTWDEARAYCVWAGGDLPTEAQWEKAARGRDARKYPWGNDWNPVKAFGDRPGTRKSTVPAETLEEGRSGYGVVGLVGNVRQWCRDWFSSEAHKIDPPNNPFMAKAPVFNKTRVVRGASFGNTKSMYCLTYYRHSLSPGKKEDSLGFRCVLERGRVNPANSERPGG